MRRREFISLLAGAAAAWPLAAGAQQATIKRVGYLSDESRSLRSFELIAKPLRELGHIEGSNILFERRYAEDKTDALADFAAELVQMQVDIIITVGTPATRAAKNASNTISVVFSRIADPVQLGFGKSLARPGGNLTGVSVISADLDAKRLEILVEAVSGIKRVGVFWDPTFPPHALRLPEVERAARLLNIELQRSPVQRADELESALNSVVDQRGQALIVLSSSLFTGQLKRVTEIAIRHNLPTVFERREFAEAGGLISYGPNYSEMYRRAAGYVDRILKGAKPSDLPVEQPTKLELVLNMKTATVLGLQIPPTLLARADEVIE